MKCTKLASVAILCFSGFGVRAASATTSEVRSPVDKIYMPKGFDDNDNVEIILKGEFPDTCYKVSKVDYEVQGKTIVVTPWSIRTERNKDAARADTCLKVMVPFIQVVKVGLFKAGKYSVEVDGNNDVGRYSFEVAESPKKDSTDDFLYAPVSFTDIQVNADKTLTLELRGNFPYLLIGCMEIQEVKTFVSEGPVLVVQPIAKIVTKKEECKGGTNRNNFIYKKVLNHRIPGGNPFLVHVRTLDGNSVNSVINIR